MLAAAEALFPAHAGWARPAGGSRRVGLKSRHPVARVGSLLRVERLAWEKNGAVQAVGKTTVPAADHHGDEDQLPDHAELRTERRVDAGVSERHANGAVCADDLEEDRKHRVVVIGDAVALGDEDDEEAEDDVP